MGRSRQIAVRESGAGPGAHAFIRECRWIASEVKAGLVSPNQKKKKCRVLVGFSGILP